MSNQGNCKEVFSSIDLTGSFFFQVLQYQCGSEAGGPPDCLQYYTGTSGTVANFGFDTSQTDVAATSKYKIKIRIHTVKKIVLIPNIYINI